MIKLNSLVILLILIAGSTLTIGEAKSFNFDRSKFYEILTNGSESDIDYLLKSIQSQQSNSQKNAFEGTLLMKIAGYEKIVAKKIKIFKKGASLLENEIQANPKNIEYRFLRFTVQEHAPSVLKYNKQIQEDKKFIIAHFSKTDSILKKVIEDYAESSKVLKKSEL